MKRLHELCHPHDPPRMRRGYARQCPARQRESILRGNVIAFTRWTSTLGLSLPDTADLLHLSPRTLRDWHTDHRMPMPRFHLLGRPTDGVLDYYHWAEEFLRLNELG